MASVDARSRQDLVAELETLRAEVEALRRGIPAPLHPAAAHQGLAQAPIGMHSWELQEDGRLVFAGANVAADEILGLDHQRLVGQPVEVAFPALVGTEIPERYRSICRSGGTWTAEQVLYEDERIAGAYEVHAFQTGPRHMTALFVDTTARQREQARLRLQRDLSSRLASFQGLDEALALCLETAIAVTALDGGAVYLVEPQAGSLELVVDRGLPERFVESVRRYDAGSLQGRIVHHGRPRYFDRELLGRAREESPELAGAQALAALPVLHETRVVACLVLTSSKPDPIGPSDRLMLEGIAAQMGGAIARLRTTDELVRMRALLEAAIAQTPAGVIMADAPDGRIRLVNDAALAIRGGTRTSLADIPAELHPARWRTFWPDETPVAPEELPLSRALRHGEASSNVELFIERDDGERRWVLAQAAPVRDPAGRIIAGVVVFPDITDLKRAEEERASLEAQLAQSQKMESIGQLAGGVAHDFNNMLTAIIGYCELLGRSLLGDRAALRNLGRIRDAADRAAALTSQLLAFSRKHVVSPRVVSLNDGIARLGDLLSRLISEDVELRFVAAPDLWPVKVDPTHVDQIIVNLVTNARDALPGGGLLTIETANVSVDAGYARTHREAREGDFVMLAVSDNGIGMDPATAQRVFEPFFTTKPSGQGTGLGLATAYGVVKQAGGFIGVYTEPDIGTTLKVYLPRTTEEPSDAVEQRPARVTRSRGERILVVEDQAAVRALVAEILSEEGYQVLSAGDPVEALTLARLEAGPIDLLLTDVVLPRMNGRELYQLLLASRSALRALFMSGYTDNVIARHGVLDRGLAFLQKPFTAQDLLARVREVLGD